METFIDASISRTISTGGSQEQFKTVDFVCNWMNVLRNISNELLETKRLSSIEDLQDLLYEQFCLEWENINTQPSDAVYFLLTAPNKLETIKLLLHNNRNCKIIVVNRKPVARAFSCTIHARNHFRGYSSTNRMDPTELYSSNLFFKYDTDLLSYKFAKQSEVFRQEVNRIECENQNVYQVDFENFFENRNSTIDELLNFLSLNKEDIVYRLTLNSNDLENDGPWLSGKINENPYSVLSKQQLRYYEFLIGDRKAPFKYSRTLSVFAFITILAGHRTDTGNP